MILPTILSILVTLLVSLEVRSIDGASAFVSPPPRIDSNPRILQPQQHQNAPLASRPLRRSQVPLCRRSSRGTRLHSSAGSGFGSSKNSKVNKPKSSSPSPPPRELFELQELRAQLQTILKQNILQQSLSSEKRAELTKYVEAVVAKADSPIDFSGRGGNAMGIAQFVAGVENKSWRMAFSTDAAGGEGEGGSGTAGDLPYGSTVILRIGEFVGTDGRLDYVLKFGKRVMGLNELVAKSKCSVDIGVVNPGLFTFEYEDIKTNVFGVSNLPVGFFGLLKGRVNYIDTVWFDGERWIERNYSENGDVVYSVYVRDAEDEKERAKDSNWN